MKSLYSILGISPDASAAKIESAYAELLLELGKNPQQDDAIRLTAAKEAYSVLSDPAKRQLYNQKLFAPETIRYDSVGGTPDVIFEPEPSRLKNILLVGTIVLAGIGLYGYQAKEKEKLRIEHEHQVKMKAVQVLESSRDIVATEQEVRLERQRQLDAEARARNERAEHERFIREAERQRVQNERVEQQARQREEEEQRRAEQAEASRKRAEMTEAKQRAAREKAILQQIERDRYGRTISY